MLLWLSLILIRSAQRVRVSECVFLVCYVFSGLCSSLIALCVLALLSVASPMVDWTSIGPISERLEHHHLRTDYTSRDTYCEALFEAQTLAKNTAVSTWDGFYISGYDTVPRVREQVDEDMLNAVIPACPASPFQVPEGVFEAPQKIERWLGDTGTALHLVNRHDLTARELARIRTGPKIALHTPNGRVESNQLIDFYIPSLHKCDGSRLG